MNPVLFMALLLAAAPARSNDVPQGVRVTTSQVAERIPLPASGHIKLVLDAISGRFELRGPDLAGLAARVSAHAGDTCPKVQIKDGWVEVRCRTRRFEAFIVNERGKRFLDIAEVRGLPWRPGPDQPPHVHYEPFMSGVGGLCPGTTAAGRGECALMEGNLLQAALEFREAMRASTNQRQMAMVRLGDIALATGDPATAIGWYERAGSKGSFGRVARARVCELDGSCLDSTESVMKTFDYSGLPAPLRADMVLRAARAEAYSGRTQSALQIVSSQIGERGMGGICRDGDGAMICRRLALDAFRTVGAISGTMKPDERQAMAEAAFQLYLALPGWDRGPLAGELGRGAAEVAALLGAPVFAANILSAVAPEVAPSDLGDHLLRAAELYVRGKDGPRARLILEFAQSRLGRKANTARWAAVQQGVAQLMSAPDGGTQSPEQPKYSVDGSAISKELTDATAAIARSRLVTSRLEEGARQQEAER